MKKNKKNKRPNGIPTGIMRLDKETMSEIKMYYSITNNIEATAKAYGVSRAMVEYALRNACSFNSLQNDLEKEEDK
ncbi:MAG TPA: hypothetical protein VFC79_05695 [Tissierellaceae bacterium]|nr:hypothetical protein [Tissierellaceae bacterium]